MARVDELFNFLQTPGLSDQQIAAEIGRLGVTASEVSQLTGVPVADVQSRLTAVAPAAPVSTAPTFGTAQETQLFNYLQTPGLSDQQIAAEIGRLGVNAQQVSSMTGVPLAQVQSRIAGNTVRPPPVVPPIVRPPPVVPTPTNISQFQTFLQTPGLTDAQILAEMGRLGITNRNVSSITGVPVTDVENRVNALSPTLPFANATQGFAQNFNNFTSIPIGAQFNPGVVGGAGSPYSQIMSQMSPVGNPYATARSGLPMGGYDPNIYDPNLYSRTVQERVDRTMADKAEATAQQVAMENGGFNGGLITKVMGPKPNTPDDGTMFVQKGEYIVKRDSVNKYGKGLLDMINDGKIPAKKIKSLLD